MLLTQDDLLQYYPHYTGEGSFVARAFVANDAYPVSQVKITLYACLPDNIWKPYRILFTDENGETAPLPLPAPDKSASAAPPLPNAAPPFAVYRATAEKDGYTTIRVDSIPVFDGITSRQNFPLIPLSDPAGLSESQSDDNTSNEEQVSSPSDIDVSDMNQLQTNRDMQTASSFPDTITDTQTIVSSEQPETAETESAIDLETNAFSGCSQDVIQTVAQRIAENLNRQLTIEELQYITQETMKNMAQNPALFANNSNDISSVPSNESTPNFETDTADTTEQQETTTLSADTPNDVAQQLQENETDDIGMMRNTQSSLLEPDDTGSADATYENLQQPE